MAVSSGSRLLTPPPEKEEIYPFHPVWRGVAVMSGILLGVTLLLFMAGSYLGIQFPAPLADYMRLLLAFLPAALWLLFSWWPEWRVLQPRQHLLAVAVCSALVANAIGIPLINDFLRVDEWLPLSSAVNRIVGYTFTVGIVQELLKYLVIRYIAWSNDFRIRLDALAYAVASAIGYSTVLNLHFIVSSPSSPDITALRVFSNYALHLTTSLIVAYGLSEVRFANPAPIFLMMMYSIASLVTGIAIPIRAGLVNAQFSLEVAAPRSLFGLGFSTVLLVISPLIVSFLFSNAERRIHEAAVQLEN
jgi:RsiW-degrading membrane proteinase PrsW (M82 family)